MNTNQAQNIVIQIFKFLLIYYSLTLFDLSLKNETLSISLTQTRILYSLILLGLLTLNLKEKIYASLVIFAGIFIYILFNFENLSKEFIFVCAVFFIPLIIDKYIFEKINLKVVLFFVLLLHFLFTTEHLRKGNKLDISIFEYGPRH